MKLSGQKAVFTVTLNYISESVLPELTDSWVADNFGSFGTPNNIYTVEALRAYYQEQLYTSNLNTAVMDYLLENSTFKSIPQQVMDYQVNQCLNYYSTLAGYCAMTSTASSESLGYRKAPTICWPISRAVTEKTAKGAYQAAPSRRGHFTQEADAYPTCKRPTARTGRTTAS